MKVPLSLIVLCMFLFAFEAPAQKRKPAPKPKPSNIIQTPKITGNAAVVIDETLGVLRVRPSLFSDAVQRMRRGRKVQIIGEREADGVKFYRISALPKVSGWIQTDAVFGKFRRGDDERLARLVQASNGFDQLEVAVQFLEMYPESALRPAILLLFGDLAEEIAVTLSRNAAKRLSRREMAATGAPLHSYYLNFVSLDRYRKLGVIYLFNSDTKNFHYNGETWKEIIKKNPNTNEAAEAQKRLDSLKEKLESK
jgi:hypothetical protein